MYTVFVAETATGNVIGTIPCIIQNWSRIMNGSDSAEIDILPGTLTKGTRDNYRLLTTPWRSSLIIDWDGVVVWAGPVIARNFDGTKPAISAQGFKALLNKRKVHDWSTPYGQYTVAFTGKSLGQIAVSLVQLATSGTKVGSSLPIVYPTLTETDSDSTHVRTYNGYELKNTGTELDNLTKSLNGPDIDFLPQWVDATRQQIQWIMRVGTLAQPVLASPSPVLFDATSPKSSVQKITEKEDGSAFATTEWAKGNGNASQTIIAQATDTSMTSQLWPLLEGQIDYSTVTDPNTLQSHAQSDLNFALSPLREWGVEVNAFTSPTLGSYLLGDNVLLRVKDHIWIPDSPAAGYAARIISIGGDNTPTVKLGVQ